MKVLRKSIEFICANQVLSKFSATQENDQLKLEIKRHVFEVIKLNGKVQVQRTQDNH
jgi:hypothetical protein